MMKGRVVRTRVIIWLLILSVALLVCAAISSRSKKPIAPNVRTLLISLVPPIVGNLLIIVSNDSFIALIGRYIFNLGLDFTVISLIRFTVKYCSIKWDGTAWRVAVLAIIGIDMVQLMLNPFFGHAFFTSEIIVEGAPYFAMTPLLGQMFHRVVVYGVFLLSVGLFTYKTVTTPHIYFERYLVILLAMVLTGVWQSYYIFSGSPVDRSMVSFGMFGLLVFFIALYYKPVILLDRMLSRVVTDLNDAVFFFDRDHQCIYSNSAGRKLFGIDESGDLQPCTEKLIQIVGADTFSFEHDWSCKRTVLVDDFEALKGAGQAGESPESTGHPDADNDKLFFTIALQTLNDEKGSQEGSFLGVRDVTREEQKQRRERYNAIHDPLTGLYNAPYLYEQGAQVMSENPDVTFCVVGVDIREFKLINDVYSKEFGDKVLCSLADSIRTHATPHQVYGRISGDRFGFVVPADEFEEDLVEEHLRVDMLELSGVTNPVVIHIGIYETDDEVLPLSVMFDRAFMAVTSIKHDYRQRIAHYDSIMRENALWNQRISTELDDAIATGQIRPYLQPMVDEAGNVQGAEVLVRWMHPEEGLLSPARFIPFFEENGRIAQLDLHMWECACKILTQWQESGIDLFLSVNISPKDFYFMDVYEAIHGLVQRYGVDPHKLRLEITETVMMSDIENRLRIIDKLRADGFYLEMDDFGSGYSSLNMLKDIPVDMLKVDMAFLYKTKDQHRAETILKTIINLSRQLNMPSVTEGVETASQLNMLTSMGCHLFQGYYFAKPMPVDEFEREYCQAA